MIKIITIKRRDLNDRVAPKYQRASISENDSLTQKVPQTRPTLERPPQIAYVVLVAFIIINNFTL